MHAGACQSLGFVCDWHVDADSRALATSALMDHLNATHGVGSTSPALAALIDRHVTDLPAEKPGSSTNVQEHAS